QGVTDDMERFRFNTMVSKLMIFAGELSDRAEQLRGTGAWTEAIRSLVLLMAPAMPALAEELWATIGGPYSVHTQSCPSYDPALTAVATATVAVQVDGKVRDKLEVAADAGQDAVYAEATRSERIARLLEGKRVAKVIYVPGRLLSIVTTR